MKTIGLIGGMSWESTTTYYKLINQAVRAARGGVSSAPILLHSFDFSRIVSLQKADNWSEAARTLGSAGRGLASAGADCLLICTNTMHLVSSEVEQMAGIPLIDIIGATAAALVRSGCRRPLLLGTKYTMEHGFYARRMDAHGIELMVPSVAADRNKVHNVIFDELCQGRVLDSSRNAYLAIIERARAAGADSVILGCTEIGLLLDPRNLPLPGFDSTVIHSDAAVRFALPDARSWVAHENSTRT